MKNITTIIFLGLLYFTGTAQELESILEQEAEKTTFDVPATFKGTRIANGQSVETRKKGVLEFLITHRFGRINSGFYNLFGLDEANIRLALEYAITDNLTMALGRSSFEKTYDGYVKYRLLHQKTGEKTFPISLTLFGSATEITLKDYDPDMEPSFADRLTYTSQIFIARKFSHGFSLQLSPTYIHFNTVPTSDDPNDIFALGIGGRIKVSNRVAINGEYYYNFNKFKSFDTYNSIAIGVEIETGGHVFQLVFTNSRPMIEKGFITETTGDFFDGDIHFGFNISRAFHLIKTHDDEKLY
jgi:hypothetical protein